MNFSSPVVSCTLEVAMAQRHNPGSFRKADLKNKHLSVQKGGCVVMMFLVIEDSALPGKGDTAALKTDFYE